MDRHQEKYKAPSNSTNVNNRRVLRASRQAKRQRENRADNYAQRRNVPESAIDEASPAAVDQSSKLERWRQEREMKKKLELQRKKPVFKVSVVHHKFYSPPPTNKPEPSPVPCHSRGGRKCKHQPTPPKRVTRATQKRLEAKLAGTYVTPVSSVKVQSNRTRKIKKRLPSTTNEEGLSLVPKNYSFKAPEGVTEVPLFGRFVIPSAASGDKSCRKEATELPSETNEDQPWPQPSCSVVDTMAQRSLKSSFVRQDAVEELSLELPEEPSRINSSMETLVLRLSLEEESLTETNIAATPINGEKNAGSDVEEINEPDAEESAAIAKIIETENKTPVRSGTPVPAFLSPYIVSSRGKNHARKEQKTKMGIGRSPADEVPTKDTVMQNLNISIEDEEKTAQYFKFIMQREIERLTKMCDKWEDIMKDPDLTEDAQYQINQAIGQTKLLMRKKIERFRSLVSDCETGKGEMLVQCRDLQGFWDMVDMEIKDCESRFLKLDQLKENDWVEEQTFVTSQKITKKKAAPSKTKVNAKSSARSWILAERKKKMSQNEDPESDDIVAAVRGPKSATRSTPKKQNARRSPRNSPSAPTPDAKRNASKTPSEKRRSSLLKQVQLSEASKNVRSPLAVMKISKMWKTPRVELDDTISYVNSDQTPAKGILKKSDDSSGADSGPPRSMQKVDFKDDVYSDEVFSDEVEIDSEVNDELQNSIDLGRALARIEDYFSDPETPDTAMRAEKRLEFDDDSFDETETGQSATSSVAAARSPRQNTNIEISSVLPTKASPDVPEARKSSSAPLIRVITPSPLPRARKTHRKTSKTREMTSSLKETLVTSSSNDQPADTSMTSRVLRNRTVVAEPTSKRNRRSRDPSTIQQNISVDSSTKENTAPSTDLQMASETVDVKSSRRSKRKNVKLNAEDCTLETERSSTPRTRRSSKRVSLLGDPMRNSVVPPANGDLMSFDSPL